MSRSRETLTQRFQRYAEDFERCHADGDWSRLRAHFTDDVVHERHVGPLYDFRDVGIERVLERFEEAVENIDRRFDRRIFVPTGPVVESGSQTRMPWVCLFLVEGAPACVDEGVEVATFHESRIRRLEGLYLDEVVERIARWGARYGHLVPGVAEYMARA